MKYLRALFPLFLINFASAQVSVKPSDIKPVATATVLGRATAGSGSAEQLATTGTGAVVQATSPVLVTPNLGTPSTLVATNATGTALGLTAGNAGAVPVSGITGLGTGVATALAVNVGTAGAPVVNGGAGGTPSSITLTNATGTAAGLTAGTANATPASGLTGTTLASNVVASSIVSPWSQVAKAGSSLADLTTRSASDLSSGTLPDGRFPATLPAASGMNLTAINAGNLASGTVPSARLPAASTSVVGAVQFAGNANAAAGVSATLGTSVDDTARASVILAGYNTGERNWLGKNPPKDLSKVFSRWIAETPNGLNVALSLAIGDRRNLWVKTEDVASAYYATTNATKVGDSITLNGVQLWHITSSNFYGSLYSQIAGLGLTPYTAGNYYILSCFVLSVQDHSQFPGQYSPSSAPQRTLIAPLTLRRITRVAYATSTTELDYGGVGTVAWGSGTPSNNCYWPFIVGGYPDGSAASANSVSVYAGGFQIERIATDGKEGIIGIGDSTMDGSSGGQDSPNSLEWMAILGAELNTFSFNRGVGGNKTADMDARWATSVTPLAARARYVLIQPSAANDIPNGVTLASTQTSVNSMVAKAIVDNLLPVIVVPTSTAPIAANSGYQATYAALCTWIRQTFPRVLDHAAIVNDPWNPYQLRRASGWEGDGTHFGAEAKAAIGEYDARAPFWSLAAPSPYQPILANTYTPPTLSTYGTIYEAMGSNLSANVATLVSGTVTVANTKVTALSKVRLTRQSKNSSTAIGSLSLGTITAGTSFVINSLDATGSVVALDASTVFWEIIEPTP